MVRVVVKPNEDLETALKRFKRRVKNSGVLQQVKSKEYYVGPSLKKRLKHEAAVKALKKKKKKR